MGAMSPLLLLEISLVGEWQAGLGLLEHIQCELRRRFTFEMEMSLQGVDLLSASGAHIKGK